MRPARWNRHGEHTPEPRRRDDPDKDYVQPVKDEVVMLANQLEPGEEAAVQSNGQETADDSSAGVENDGGEALPRAASPSKLARLT